MRILCAGAWGLAATLLAAAALAHGEKADRAATTASDSDLRFALPAAGSYALPPIARVREHHLLDPEGNQAAMLDLAGGQLAVVSFIYTHCPQAQGCPLALAVLQRVDRLVAQRPDLAARVRLVTLSFDPARDTPARMGQLRAHMRPASDWRFLTAGSADQIQPVLEDFGQDVRELVGGDGVAVGLIGHVLKVFLVDSSRAVRNIYSTGLLSPELLLLDLETLLLEEQAGGEALARGEVP